MHQYALVSHVISTYLLMYLRTDKVQSTEYSDRMLSGDDDKMSFLEGWKGNPLENSSIRRAHYHHYHPS